MADLFALVAEFNNPDALLEATRQARAKGFTRIEAYSPFPVEGVAEAIGFKERWISLITLAGGIVGALVGYGMQVYVNLDYPLNIGGRPQIAPPAFMLITFELLVLFSVLACIISMLALNGLPRLNHPIFDVEGFRLASSDKFFLAVMADDHKFDPKATRRFLEGLSPIAVNEAPLSGAPE
ncbi:MAG TPA: DUF3341 domain-containing protein [Caulobacteraceae bacterium]|jgi:hypothetical protein|nr:DUF3341 domain-containing protein [Caulobacteraceae bacterium]